MCEDSWTVATTPWIMVLVATASSGNCNNMIRLQAAVARASGDVFVQDDGQLSVFCARRDRLGQVSLDFFFFELFSSFSCFPYWFLVREPWKNERTVRNVRSMGVTRKTEGVTGERTWYLKSGSYRWSFKNVKLLQPSYSSPYGRGE